MAQTKADSAAADVVTAQAVATAAQNAANAAQAEADEARTAANNAQTVADKAEEDLAAAKAELQSVTSRVGATEEDIAAAEAAVVKAQNAADTAKSEAQTAAQAAAEADEAAKTAQSTANTAKTAADTAQAAANAAQQAANAAQSAVDSLAVRVTTAETNITQNSEQIALRAKKTEVTQMLGGYYTKEEADAALTVKANEITSNVSSAHATIDAKVTAAKSTADIAQSTADIAKATADSKNKVYEDVGNPNYTGEGNIEPLFTNLVDTATTEAGGSTIYDSDGYSDNMRWSSSGNKETELYYGRLTGWIPYTAGATYRIKNMGMNYLISNTGYVNGIYFVQNTSGINTVDTISQHATDVDRENDLIVITPSYICDFFRLSGFSLDKDKNVSEAPIITCNEEIVYGEVGATGNPNSPSVQWKKDGTEANHVGDLYIGRIPPNKNSPTQKDEGIHSFFIYHSIMKLQLSRKMQAQFLES